MTDHDEAVSKEWSALYALGQLPEKERDRFEEHMFDCPECSANVRAASLMVRGAEATLNRPIFGGAYVEMPAVSQHESASAWRKLRWALPALAYAGVALLSVGVGIQYTALQRARGPQIVVATKIEAQAKGAATRIVLPASAGLIELDLDLLESAPRYIFEIRPTAAERPLVSTELTHLSGDSLKISLPADKLRPGDYEVIITAEPGKKTYYPFEVVAESKPNNAP